MTVGCKKKKKIKLKNSNRQEEANNFFLLNLNLNSQKQDAVRKKRLPTASALVLYSVSSSNSPNAVWMLNSLSDTICFLLHSIFMFFTTSAASTEHFFSALFVSFFPHMQANPSNHTGIIANPDTPLSLPCLQVLRVEGWHTGGLVTVAFVGHKAMQPCTWVTLRDSFLVNLFARVFCTNVASSLWFGLLSIWEKTFSEFSENSALLTRTPETVCFFDLTSFLFDIF